MPSGEILREKTARGPRSVQEALTVAVQIAGELPSHRLFANDPNVKGHQDVASYIALLPKAKQQWEYCRSNL